jgi:hypothetical protein
VAHFRLGKRLKHTNKLGLQHCFEEMFALINKARLVVLKAAQTVDGRDSGFHSITFIVRIMKGSHTAHITG